MGIGSGTAMLIGGLASAGGSIASGAMGSSAAQNAAAAQQAAAEKAAQFQQQQSQNALNYQENEFNTAQGNLAPYLQSGTGALSNLNYMMGITPQPLSGSSSAPLSTATSNLQSVTPSTSSMPGLPASSTGGMFGASNGGNRITPTPLGATSNVRINSNPIGGPGAIPISATGSAPQSTFGAPSPMSSPGASNAGTPGGFGSLMQPYGQTFQAPTGLTEQNDPGYQARLNLGQQAMEQSAAARGGLLTGGNLQAENQLAQDYASNEYQNVYNRALNTFGTNFNVYNTNQANQFNRLAAMSGMGQSAANTLGGLGQEAANAVSNNLLSTGQMVGNDYQNAAAANATGIYNSANAMNGMIGGITGAIGGMTNLSMLRNMLGGGNASGILNMAQNQNLNLSPTDPTLSELIS